MTPGKQRRVDRCGRLMAISTFTADWLARRAGIDRCRIELLALPYDPRLRGHVQEARTEAPSPTLITVSRLAPEHRYKGHFSVAESIAKLRGDFPDLRWNVVGSGKDLPALRAHCDRLGITESVNFAGSVPDEHLVELYRESWVHVLPSVADPEANPPVGEGFGLVYVEAALHGVPSIASMSGGGALDFVNDGVTGRLVPHQEPEAVAATIAELCTDAAQRRALGTAARQRAMERHSPAAFAATLKEVLL
ncbi:MAG: glycosyltransferase [Actinomycetota bacterium]|nr:glycosyltransferase [Actinomycetota bacterium]